MLKGFIGATISIAASFAATAYAYVNLFSFATAAKRGDVEEMLLISTLVFVVTGLTASLSMVIKKAHIQEAFNIYLHLGLFFVMAVPMFGGYAAVLMDGNPESSAYIWYWILYVAMGLSGFVATFATPRRWIQA